jgi:hypothetical protein
MKQDRMREEIEVETQTETEKASLLIMREKNRSSRDHAGSSNKSQASRPFKFEMIRRLMRCDASMAGGPKCLAR